MGCLMDCVRMDAGKVELCMQVTEGEYENWDGKGPLKTRLDFYENYPGCYSGHRPPAHRIWFDTLKEAQDRLRATVPAMYARFMELCEKHGA